MTFAFIALVRSIDTSNLIAGNLAFKQGATLSAEGGAEKAIEWLTSRNGSLELYTPDRAAGYYATSQSTLDPTNSHSAADVPAVDWDDNNCQGIPNNACVKPAPAITVGDNAVSYLINRLCNGDGDSNSAANSCATFQAADSPSPQPGDRN